MEREWHPGRRSEALTSGDVHRRSRGESVSTGARSGCPACPAAVMVRGMKRTGRTWPTFAAELLRARATLRLGDEVGLAIRADRSRLGLSQRAYAAERGLTEAAVIRLESAADSMKLGDVVSALSGTAFMLCLCHRPPDVQADAGALAADSAMPDTRESASAPAGPAGRSWPPDPSDPPAPADTPAPVHPAFWPRAELVARVRGGRRRFPAHHVTEQVTYPPNWWWYSESTQAGAVPPHWYAPRYSQRRRSAS